MQYDGQTFDLSGQQTTTNKANKLKLTHCTAPRSSKFESLLVRARNNQAAPSFHRDFIGIDLSTGNDGGSNDTTTDDPANEQESEDDTDGSAKPSKSGLRERFQAGIQSVAARPRKGRKY